MIIAFDFSTKFGLWVNTENDGVLGISLGYIGIYFVKGYRLKFYPKGRDIE